MEERWRGAGCHFYMFIYINRFCLYTFLDQNPVYIYNCLYTFFDEKSTVYIDEFFR